MSGHSWEAAFHEAGHVVVAEASQFHGVAHGKVSLTAYGAGFADVRLSRKKVVAAGKTPEPSVEHDPDVAASFAMVLAAGLVAERIAAQTRPQMAPNPACAAPDHAEMQQQLAAANVPYDLTRFEAQAKAILIEHWFAVERLATALQHVGSLTSDEALQLIDRRGV